MMGGSGVVCQGCAQDSAQAFITHTLSEMALVAPVADHLRGNYREKCDVNHASGRHGSGTFKRYVRVNK